MKKISLLLAALALVGAGCITIVEPGDQPAPPADTGTTAEQPVTTDDLNDLFQTACTETGGTFDAETATCTCGDAATLDEDSGECMLEDGTPDGMRGEEMRARYELMVACKETAGNYDDDTAVCTCPDSDTLDEESGECRTADGDPDGIRGQEARELRFKTNCENSDGVFNSEETTCSCQHGNVADDGTCPEAPPPAEEDPIDTDTGTTTE
jgi:hypothetical protein